MLLRVVRAAAFAVVSVVLGIGAHVFAGGGVSAGTVVIALVAVFLFAGVLAGRERSKAVIFPALAASQAGLHVLFSYGHGVEPLAAQHHAHSGLGMLVAHVWAAGMTALWLARGEAFVWALLRRLESRLRPLAVAVADPADTSSVPPMVERITIPRPVMLGHEVGRRGPPPSVSTVTA
ncbi:MFS transporter [Acrocarpospora catenulata]|uniref:MFS transporter n=1 Tax=Acrocarpospora catenulata TaxID=2836182 RepID=UPI001BD9C4AF|nr:MFS transporter [Acrocarpospora catenulata]